VNSRHPDPRRVWKGGPELRPMTPDPWDTGDRGDTRDTGMSSRPPIPLQTSIEKWTSGPPGGPIFEDFPRERPQGTPMRPKGLFSVKKTPLRGNATPGHTAFKKGRFFEGNKKTQGQR
jgi:hypothetical protein